VERFLFTGDRMSAGLIGSTASSYAKLYCPTRSTGKSDAAGEMIVLPGHGPPTTIEAERRFNVGMEAAKKAGAQRIVRPGYW
jgi:glyoxylase-like metal-dependent hydrolase (beta-lactamase superfamily II)